MAGEEEVAKRKGRGITMSRLFPGNRLPTRGMREIHVSKGKHIVNAGDNSLSASLLTVNGR